MEKKQKINNDILLVSGPVIALRLEGFVNNIKKIVYLFGDIHMNVTAQSQCPSWKADEFIRYFSKTMKYTNKNKQYDLFFETGSTGNSKNILMKDRYIDEVDKYFKSTLNIVNKENKENKENEKKYKNTGSNEEANLRLHHIDPRGVFKNLRGGAYDQFYYLDSLFYNIQNNFGIHSNQLENIKNIVFLMNESLEIETFLLLNDESNEKYEESINKLVEFYGEDNYKIIKRLIKKLKDDYYSEYVKNKLISESGIFEEIRKKINSLKIKSEEFIKNLENLQEHTNTYGKLKYYESYCNYGSYYSSNIENTLPAIKSFNYIGDDFIYMYALLMDIATLRRLLDKDYITNIISYTGAAHTCNYLYILVKYFDFKITHCTNKEHTINEIEILLKESNNSSEVFCKVMPNVLFQCIDITDFPDKFE